MMGKVMAMINSARGAFVYGILTKWYLAIAIPAMGITYIVFKKLDEKGVFDLILDDIKKNLVVLEYIAEECTPKILNFDLFYQCINF